MGQGGEGGDEALSSLWPRYHTLVFTVDVSQWLGFIISSGGKLKNCLM